MVDPIQSQQSFAEFRRRRSRQLTALLPLALVFIGLFWLQAHPNEELLGLPVAAWAVILGVVVLGFIAFTLTNWRCPSCRAYLGKGISPRFCRQCGAQLQE